MTGKDIIIYILQNDLIDGGLSMSVVTIKKEDI